MLEVILYKEDGTIKHYHDVDEFKIGSSFWYARGPQVFEFGNFVGIKQFSVFQKAESGSEAEADE